MINSVLSATEHDTTVYYASMDWLRNLDVSRIATGFLFTEGPVWHPGGYFLFSDTPANKIYRLSPQGKASLLLEKIGWEGRNREELSDQVGSNAIAIDADENIFICQHGNHAIAKLDQGGNFLSILDRYNGRPFNSPNDLVIGPDNSIYFTDPPYGLAGQVLHPEKFQPLAGVYQYSKGETRLFGTELQYPNGLALSNDKRYLFVSSNDAKDPGIVRYRLTENQLPVFDGVLMKQHADGTKMGSDGLLYMATDKGILIADTAGHKKALLRLPETPSNLCFGGTAQDIIMVTARTSVYFINTNNTIL